MSISEAVILFIRWLRVRKARRIAQVGVDCRIYASAQIINGSGFPDRIFIDNGAHISGRLLVWNNCGRITIGESSYVGEGTRLYSSSSIIIGKRVQIAHGCNIFDNNIHSLNPEERFQEFVRNTKLGLIDGSKLRQRPVLIQDDAWIGANSIVLKGVTVGRGAIVGAGSVVVRDVPDFTIVAGNPARVIKTIDH